MKICDSCGNSLETLFNDDDYISCIDCDYNICNDCVENNHRKFYRNIRRVRCGGCNNIIKNYYGFAKKYYVKEKGSLRVIDKINIYEVVGCDVKNQLLKLMDDDKEYKYCKYGSQVIYSDNPPQCKEHFDNQYFLCTDDCYNFQNKHDLLEDYDYIQGVKKINKELSITGNKIQMEYLYEDDFNKAKKDAIKSLDQELEKLINKKKSNNTAEIRKEIEDTIINIDKQKNSIYLYKMFKDFTFDPHEVKKKEKYKVGGFEGDNERMVF